MNDPIRGPVRYDPELILWGTLFEPHEPEQAESAETMIAVAQRPCSFVVMVLRALSAWPT